MFGILTGGVPQAELHNLIVDIDIVHVVLEYCWFAGAATEVGLGPWLGSGGPKWMGPRGWTHYTWVKKPFVKTFSSEVLPVRNIQVRGRWSGEGM